MQVQSGYLYHIKDKFFEVVNDDKLMTNHERGKKRPTYFTIKDGDVLWFIPLSSKVDKYTPIINKKIKKYGECNSILIRKILNKDAVILIQNAFPTLEKYIDHVHTDRKGNAVRLVPTLCEEILINFKKLLELKKMGINLFFADIDAIKEKMLEELKINNRK